MNEADARYLFTRYYPHHDSADDVLLSALFEAVGYNTLVIELLAKRLGSVNSDFSKPNPLCALLDDLQKRGILGIPASDRCVTTDYRFSTAKPEEIVSGMYEISELGEGEKSLLALFSVMPTVHIPYDHLCMLQPETDGRDDLLRALSQRGWLEYDKEQKSFRCNPIVQEIVRKKSGEALGGYCEAMLSSLIELLDYDGGTGTTLRLTYEQAVQFVQYGEIAGNHLKSPGTYLVALLFDRLGTFFAAYGNLDRSLVSYETFASISRILYDSNPQNVGFKNGLAISYIKLGVFYRDPRKNSNMARKYFIKAKTLFDALAREFPSYAEFRKNYDWVNRALDDL